MPQLKLCDSFDKYFSFFVAYLSMESIDNAGTFFRSCLIRDIEHTEREISRMRYTEGFTGKAIISMKEAIHAAEEFGHT